MRRNRPAADDRYGQSDAPLEWRSADLLPRAECSPVRHDLDEAVISQAAQCLDDGVPGHAVMLRQFGHSRQPLAGLPFPGAAPSAQVVLDPARGQLRSPWRHADHDRKIGLTCAHRL